MNRTRKSSWWGAMLVLSGALWALPAAADGERCEADCATKTSEPMQACMEKCPQPSNPRDPKAARTYQSCAMRCSNNFQERFNTCKKKCADTQPKKK